MSMVELKITRKKFVDLDLNFTKHPVSSDVSKKVNENAIIASIRNLLMTRKYERPFHPEISSQIMDLLFEPLTNNTAAALKRTIYYVIQNFEPRVEVLLVDVEDTPDYNEVKVLIAFKIVGDTNIVKAQFFLQRTL